MNDRERREADRVRFESHIVIKTSKDTVGATADSRNISLRGIYLVPEKKLPLDTACTLDITLTGYTSKMTVTVPGRICRHDDQGMAVDFLDMQVDCFVHIKNLIKLHTAEDTTITPAVSPGP